MSAAEALVLLAALGCGIGAAALLGMHAYETLLKRRGRQSLLRRLGAAAGEGPPERRGRLPAWRFAQPLLRMLGLSKERPVDEAELPQLIDVVRLGLDAGMSFEQSLSLYAERFDTGLSRFCRPYALKMQSGVESRQRILAELSEQAGIRSLSRMGSMAARSQRNGSRLSPALGQLAAEVRKSCRAAVEEKISKAPTKMLIPTGVLILPAMLLLVGGPFLIDLLEHM